MKISFLSLLKVGITSNYIKSLGLILAFFVTAYENSRNFIEHSDFDEKKIDAYLDRGLAMQSAAVIVILMLFYLIINLIRTVF
jgi:putative membrane protein